MIILGIDPGITSVGYAILRHDGYVLRLTTAGLFNIQAAKNHERLEELHRELVSLIRKHRPTHIAVEKLFFAKNVKTALSVAEARGSILLTTALAGITLSEYTPLEVKKTVTGDGTADKKQVQKMIRLSIQEAKDLRARDDVFDAIAIAITCAAHNKFFVEKRTLYSICALKKRGKRS